MNTRHVLLHGATTPLGEQLLLKLAIAGFEVTAQVPPSPWQGRTGEYAAHVTEETVAATVGQATGESVIVVAAEPVSPAEVEAALAHAARIERWVQCSTSDGELAAVAGALHAASVPVTAVLHAPVYADFRLAARDLLTRRTPLGAWRALWRPSVAAVDEAAVAEAAVKGLHRGSAAVAVPGAPVTMRDVLRATATSDALSPWWLPVALGRERHSPLRFRRTDLPSSLPT